MKSPPTSSRFPDVAAVPADALTLRMRRNGRRQSTSTRARWLTTERCRSSRWPRWSSPPSRCSSRLRNELEGDLDLYPEGHVRGHDFESDDAYRVNEVLGLYDDLELGTEITTLRRSLAQIDLSSDVFLERGEQLFKTLEKISSSDDLCRAYCQFLQPPASSEWRRTLPLRDHVYSDSERLLREDRFFRHRPLRSGCRAQAASSTTMPNGSLPGTPHDVRASSPPSTPSRQPSSRSERNCAESSSCLFRCSRSSLRASGRSTTPKRSPHSPTSSGRHWTLACLQGRCCGTTWLRTRRHATCRCTARSWTPFSRTSRATYSPWRSRRPRKPTTPKSMSTPRTPSALVFA